MRRLSTAVVLFTILAAVTGVLAGKSPVDVSDSGFAGVGKLKAKLKRFGSEKGPAEFTVEFGAAGGLAADGFRITLDDGEETITVPGTFALNEKGRQYVMTPDAPALQAEMTELFWRLLGTEIPGVSIDLDVTGVKVAIKPKVKRKTGETTLKLKLKFAFVVTVSAMGQTETVKTILSYRGKGVQEL